MSTHIVTTYRLEGSSRLALADKPQRHKDTSSKKNEPARVIHNKGYVNQHTADKDGNIYQIVNGKPELVITHKNSRDYLAVFIKTKSGVIIELPVHIIMRNTWLRPTPSQVGLTVDHVDGNKYNNALSNLELVTMQENHRRAREMHYAKVNQQQHV